MISNRITKSGELDITINSDISELEKILLQVKSLRYQMYTKFLSEKLLYETKLRKLEKAKNSSSQIIKENLSENTLSSLRLPLTERNLNIMSISPQTTSDKNIQTCNFHIPNISVSSLGSSKGSFKDPNTNSLEFVRKINSPIYDEKLFKIVEQLESLALL